MERRDRQDKRPLKDKAAGLRASQPSLNALGRLRVSARNKKDYRFTNLLHLIKVDLLRAAYLKLNGKKACGWDRITKQEYGTELEANLLMLQDRIHRGAYKPAWSREVLIPKDNGKMRPLAISNFEDKMVQLAVAMVLEALYEPLFVDPSLGFRPRRGCHHALRRIRNLLHRNERPFVIDADIEKFFNSVDHDQMMAFLGKRITDPRFLRLIGRLLKTGVMKRDGHVEKNQVGTPQGSVVSPILANIYLHYVLDTWFIQHFANERQAMVRYADDAVFCFKDQKKANAFLKALKDRFQAHALKLNEEKTKIVDFRVDRHQTFDFLGFTIYWGRDRKKRPILKLRTKAEKLRKSIMAFKLWIKTNRNRFKLKVLWKKAAEILRGHYAYYGVTLNDRLGFYYITCIRLLFKWLNRRSQKHSFSWEKFHRKLQLLPLPKPWGNRLIDFRQGVLSCTV